jgi:hypothetical protein
MSREAMKMALEALEQLQGGCTDSDDGTVEAITVWCPEVIDALRQAIEQAEHVHAVNTSKERVDEIVKQEHDRAVELGQAYERGWNAALAQQEPVACIGTTGELMWLNKPKVIYSKPIPLYTAPVDGVTISEERVDETTDLAIVGEVGVWGEREWVGLTDEEVSEVIDNVLEGGGWLDVARAIEAAIKEKNT